MHHSNKCPIIKFHVYHLILHYTVYGRLPLHEKKLPIVFVLSFLCNTCRTIHKERYFYDRDINFWLSHEFLHSRNTKANILSTSCTHLRDSSLHSNIVDDSKIFCVIVIMLGECYPVFHTKFNLNTMAAINICLLKSLH